MFNVHEEAVVQVFNRSTVQLFNLVIKGCQLNELNELYKLNELPIYPPVEYVRTGQEHQADSGGQGFSKRVTGVDMCG